MEDDAVSPDSPRVESFVVRFVDDASNRASNAARAWHGVVVHVQSNEEKSFTRIADAIAFMARYIRIGDFVFTLPHSPQGGEG